MLSARKALGRARYLLVLALFIAIRAAAAEPDGPYVVRSTADQWEAWSIEVTPDGARKSVQSLKSTATITVPAVGRVPAFHVKLRTPADVSPNSVRTRANMPLFVVADTHGEFEILVEMLQKYRVVDRKLKWSFGRGHLVLLGDVFDRGPNQIEILWLIYKLEAEAAKAGGGVHLVLGNHEAMVMTGDLRYINSKYVRTAKALGAASYSELVGPHTVLGQWLRTKPAVLKMDDLLCLHGGISRQLVERNLSVQRINAVVRDTLNGVTPGQSDLELVTFVMGQLGPLWYRGYFADQKGFPTATSDDIDAIRKHFGVNTILVGHTTVPTVTPLYDARVIAVQVYPHRDEQSGQPIMEALRVENGRFLRAKIGGSVELLEIKPAAADASVAPPVPRRPN